MRFDYVVTVKCTLPDAAATPFDTVIFVRSAAGPADAYTQACRRVQRCYPASYLVTFASVSVVFVDLTC